MSLTSAAAAIVLVALSRRLGSSPGYNCAASPRRRAWVVSPRIRWGGGHRRRLAMLGPTKPPPLVTPSVVTNEAAALRRRYRSYLLGSPPPKPLRSCLPRVTATKENQYVRSIGFEDKKRKEKGDRFFGIRRGRRKEGGNNRSLSLHNVE